MVRATIDPVAVRPIEPAVSASSLPYRWLVGLELGLAAVLCTLFVWSRDLWLDEAVSASLAKAPWAEFVETVREREVNAAVYFLALRAWSVFGTSELALRSLSIVCAVGAAALVIKLTRELRGDVASLCAGAVFIVNSLFVHWGQEARGYALMMLLTTASSLLFVRAVRTDRRGPWLGFVGLSLLAAGTSFWAVFVAVGQLGSLLFRPPREVPWRRAIEATALWLLFILPMGLLVQGNRTGIGGLAGNAPGRVMQDIQDAVPRSFVAVALVAVIAVAGWALLHLHRRGPLPGVLGDWPLMFALCWMVAPAAGLIGYSYFQTPVLIIKYFIVCLPPLAVATGIVLAGLRLTWRVAALTVVLAVCLFGVVRFYVAGEEEDWSGSTAFVAAEVQEGDGVLFYAPFGRIPFEWSARDHEAITNLADPVKPTHPWNEGLLESIVYQPMPREGVAAASEPFERVWLVLSSEAPNGPEEPELAGVRDGLADAGFTVQQEKEFEGVRVLLYTRA
jgi:4-amino-4-deoxy-L-arabinose transferase-like glycosyltransferase